MPPPASRALVAVRRIVTFRCSTVCRVSQWQRLGTALARKHKAVAWFLLAAQSCRPPCLQIGALRQWQGNRHHCLSVRDGLWLSVSWHGAAAPCQSIGRRLADASCWLALASSVTMWPFLSRAFVKKATSSLSPDRRLVGLVSGKGGVPPLPSITHSKHVLRRCHSVRCSADMADTLSASSSSVTMHHTASRSLVAEWHIVTCHVFEVLWVWPVAKAEYRHCQVIGLRLAAHRAGRPGR
jgi:hypothetical protein